MNEHNLTYALQRRMLVGGFSDAWDTLMGLLENERSMATIEHQATMRHSVGFDTFGSTMYNWTPEERRQNVIEELADAIVYATSGPLS